MEFKEQLIQWAKSVLKDEMMDVNTVVDTPWSTVLKISTKEKIYYLKQTPPDLFIEFEVLHTIRKHTPNSATPKVLFKNPKLFCFLMESCGDYSLRTKFNGLIDSELYFKGLESYIHIQRSLENHLDELVQVEVPNWGLNRLPHLFTELLEKKEMLTEEGLTFDELDKLKTLVPLITSICETLSRQSVKETLVNIDFNENNLILNERTQQIFVIDLGEVVISHPFFSIAAHLNNTAHRYKLELKGPLLESIRQKWLQCWSDVANIDDLEQIYQNIYKLLPIFCALGLYRLQTATNNQSKKMQSWFIKDTLQKLCL